VDDPKENVPDELEERLDDLSATLTEDDVRTTTDGGSTAGVMDADADDTDADDADQDADADDPGL
jgi:hypothetical protein